MTSYAELLQTCTEFQDNFAVLSGKYSALAQELENEKDRNTQLRRKLEESVRREEQADEQLRSLRRELENALGYKDKLAAATVALEHMKSRMQHAQRGVTDTVTEHEQEVTQLKTQIKDLLQRIELAADGTRVEELNKQVTELEARAAAANAALLQEKEKFGQQLLVAHNALREQQARNLELEQRYRAMEGEVTEMRAAVRRSADLQNEAALLKERHATEASLAQREATGLRQEVVQVRAQLAEARQRHEEELAEVHRAAAEERAAARTRSTALSSSLAAATAAAEAEHARYTDLLRSTQQQIESARDEATVELTAVRRALAEAREETQRSQHLCDALRRERETAQRAAQQQRVATDALQAQLDAAHRQLAEAAQQEAWVSAERTHAGEQLAVAERRVEELAAALQKQERLGMDLERETMRGEMLEAELHDARRAAREAQDRLGDVEAAAGQRLQALRREVKAYHKQLKLEKETCALLRKRLVQAVAEREADLYRASRSGEAMQPSPAACCGGVAEAGLASPSCDVIGLLKRQNEEAERLHTRVLELSH